MTAASKTSRAWLILGRRVPLRRQNAGPPGQSLIGHGALTRAESAGAPPAPHDPRCKNPRYIALVSSGIEYAMGAPTSRLRRNAMDKKSGNGERTVTQHPVQNKK